MSISVRTGIAGCIAFSISASLWADQAAQDAPGLAKRRLLNVFQMGEFVTYTKGPSTASLSYSLYVYTAESKAAKQAQYAADMKEYEKEQKRYEEQVGNREVLNAKRRELMQQVRNAGPDERQQLMLEYQAIQNLIARADGRAELRVGRPDPRAAGGLPGGGIPAPRPPIQARVARPRPPRQNAFYRIVELGEDFVCIERNERQLFIPVWSIGSVSRSAKVEAQPVKADASGGKAQVEKSENAAEPPNRDDASDGAAAS